mmetsp:Transcript_27018/g.69501  ORF Transcript_27018/g.69501 Transcript_27018/m.69501 type:complete len:247 (+) Transcript_27018:86-826(+)
MTNCIIVYTTSRRPQLKLPQHAAQTAAKAELLVVRRVVHTQRAVRCSFALRCTLVVKPVMALSAEVGSTETKKGGYCTAVSALPLQPLLIMWGCSLAPRARRHRARATHKFGRIDLSFAISTLYISSKIGLFTLRTLKILVDMHCVRLFVSKKFGAFSVELLIFLPVFILKSHQCHCKHLFLQHKPRLEQTVESLVAHLHPAKRALDVVEHDAGTVPLLRNMVFDAPVMEAVLAAIQLDGGASKER